VRVRAGNDKGTLRGGMFARGVILGPPGRGIAVARAALLPGDGGAASTVAVLGDGNKLNHRSVELGAEMGDRVEVRTGLKEGERVVVTGGYSLPEGTQVEVEQ
jgi:multidrug efflux pump subunit AcrA (membrane-fusion protein)